MAIWRWKRDLSIGPSPLQAHEEYAGVAGTVEMDDAVNYEFKSRKQRINQIHPVGDCDHLGGGGLYVARRLKRLAI